MSADPQQRRFESAMVWNFASLAVLGVSGIALNLLIGRLYDAATLGVFNQALAAYIFFSQAAVGGLDRSALKEVASHAHDPARLRGIVLGALAPTLLLASLVTLAFWLARTPIADFLDSPGTATGIAAATPGLFFFALNKVLLGVVNGLNRMRAFAIYQSLRYIGILACLAGFALLDTERVRGDQLAFVFTFAEAVLFLVLAVEVGLQMRGWAPSRAGEWIGKHLVFGLKSAGSGVLLELNARVDVLMIGYYLEDRMVGVYTFAAMVAEGMYQLLVVLQNMYNPVLARHLALRSTGSTGELEALIRRGQRNTWAGVFVVGLAAALIYPWPFDWLAGNPAIEESTRAFQALVLGIVLCAGLIPFAQILLMAGHPGWHTLYMASAVAFNILGNALLIPVLGIVGAALATSASMLLSILVLRVLTRRQIGVRL
jgi:O-antigen/teichoic acid export membrane protein